MAGWKRSAVGAVLLFLGILSLGALSICDRALAQADGHDAIPGEQAVGESRGMQQQYSLSDEASSFYDTYAAPAFPPGTAVNIDLKKMEHRDNVARRGIIYLSGTAIFAFLLIAFFAIKHVVLGAHFVQAVGLVFLVYGTVMLTIIADTDEQLTAAVGILGAIAGYLFGARAAGAEPSSSRDGKETQSRP